MSMLDFSRFGVTPEELKDNIYSFIIGFDLGDGELSAAYWDLTNDGMHDPVDLRFDENENKKLLSGFFRDIHGNIFLGTPYALSNLRDAEGKLYINFKVTPKRLCDNELYEGDNVPKRLLMQTLLKECINKIYKTYNVNSGNHSMFQGRGLLVVGCPSSSEWLDNGQDVIYSRILTEALIGSLMNVKVIIMPESRASLVKVYKEQQEIIKQHLNDGVVVMDHGSSTFDVTSIDFSSNKQIDDSIPLGANKIERTMLKTFIEKNQRRRNELDNYIAHLLALRNAKEAYFANPMSTPRVHFEWTDDKYTKESVNEGFMKGITHYAPQSYSTEYCQSVQGSWAELHRQFTTASIKRLCVHLGINYIDFKGVIILTGGASKMQFIKESVLDVLPNAHVVIDPEPSYCVSRGLVWAAYTDLRAMELTIDLKKKILETIESDMPVLKEIIGKAIAPMIYDYALAELTKWRDNGAELTLTQLSKKINDDFLSSNTHDGFKRNQDVQKAFKDSISQYLNKGNIKNPMHLGAASMFGFSPFLQSLGFRESLKSRIIKLVNDMFADVFPGHVNQKGIGDFNIEDAEWNKLMNSIVPANLVINGKILSAFDPQSDFGKWWRRFIGSTYDIDRILSTEKRNEVINRFTQNKDSNIFGIKQDLLRSVLQEPAQGTLVNQINNTLEPIVDKAVNTVALYFTSKN